MTPLRVFIGWDGREQLAWHVLAHSIITRASVPVSITPLALPHLDRWLYTRTRDPRQSTDFTYTRFLVPYLSGYEGVSIFMDCDMLCRADLWDIFDACSSFALTSPPAVWVVKHDYVPRSVQRARRLFDDEQAEYRAGRLAGEPCYDGGAMKMDGQIQTAYPRKNWSSLMVFNNARCRALTPEYVNTASGADLHRFAWLRDDEIGALPLAWNYLVDEDGQTTEAPKIVHFTNGGPWFPGYEHVEYADEWRAERDAMLGAGVLV